MKLLEYKLPDNFNLFYFGDKHEGNQLSCEKGWQCLLDAMRSKYEGCRNNYGIDLGDIIEAILVNDPRFSTENLTEQRPLAQMRVAVSSRESIKKLLLAILDGNHDKKLWKYGDIVEDVCSELKVPYGTYTSKITINDKQGNPMFKTFVTHGSKNITSTADDPVRRRTNMELTLKRQLKHKAGDCAVMVKAHTHKLIVCKPEPELYLTDSKGDISMGYTQWGQQENWIHPDARWYGNSGSFLKLYGDGVSGYAEIAEYDPIELGFLVLIIRDKKIIELKKHRLTI